MALINIQIVAMDIQVYFRGVFYFLLKCDPRKETPRKAEGYAYEEEHSQGYNRRTPCSFTNFS